MRKKSLRLISTALVAAMLALTAAAYPAEAQSVRGLSGALQNSGIENSCATNPDGSVTCGSGAGGGCAGGSCGSSIAASCGGGLRGIFGSILNFIKNIFGNLFGGIFGGIFGGGGGGGCDNGGGDSGGGCPGGNCPPTDGGNPGTPSGDTGATTPGTPVTPVADGEVPAGVAALRSAIQQKFGVTMAGSWNETQLRAVNKTLSVLPVNFRKWNRYQEKAGYRGGLLGLGQVGGQGKIWIYGGAFNASKHNGTGIQTIVHEMTHNFQGNQQVVNLWRSQIRGRSVSSYGNTNHLEDMAESVAHYYLYPAQMKQTHASRYEFIKKYIMEGREFSGNEWR